MNRAALTLAITLALAAPAIAQRQPAPARPPATAQPPAPAPAQPAPAPQPQYAPSHLAAARDVAVSSGITRSFDAILPQFGDQIRKQAITRPELTKDLNEVLDALNPELELQKQAIINATARVFAARMSEAELTEIAAFFKTPSGSKYVSTQPAVLDDLVSEIETWSQGLSEYVMVRVRAELGKRGHFLQ